MRDLFIYHPGTGTVISLRDEVYLVDAGRVREDILDSMETGGTVDEREHMGIRIDNYNMTNLFFGKWVGDE
jgi:hypothetical protein